MKGPRSRALAGVVLCGGSSRRMGRDKSSLEVAGERLLLRVAARLASAADPVLIAPGHSGHAGAHPYAEVADADGIPGPLGGIVGALRDSPHDAVAVVAVDMPFVNAAVIRALHDVLGDHHAVVPITPEGSQPLHAIYARAAAGTLARAARRGVVALREAVESLDVVWAHDDVWRSADPAARFALNINTPEELAVLSPLLEE